MRLADLGAGSFKEGVTAKEIPAAIRQFVEATNNADTAAFLAAFTEKASLTDWGRDFHGRDGIARWNETDNIGVQSRFAIVRAEEAHNTWRIRISVRGAGFNGEGNMAFTLEGGLISRLVIS